MEDDAKTLEAIEKIKAILREYDLWASFSVVSQVRVHWVYHWEPSWSCIHLGPDGQARMRAKKADFATPAQHQEVVELTTSAIISTRDFAFKQFADADKIHSMLKVQLDIVHKYSDPRYPGKK